MRLSQHLLARFSGGYLKAVCLLLFTSYSLGVAAQYTPSEITLDNVDDTSELRTLHASGELDTRVSTALDSGELVYLSCLIFNRSLIAGGFCWTASRSMPRSMKPGAATIGVRCSETPSPTHF